MSHPKIDVHSHFISPSYRNALIKHGYNHADGMPSIPKWSVESHLAHMDDCNVTKSILSVSSPGTAITLDADQNLQITKESNDYAASIKSSHPTRFGYFASLSLPDIPASIEEITRVFTAPTKPDGITLLSNHHGLYLGDPRLRPVLEQLNALKAIVLIHPTSPCHGASHIREHAADRYEMSSPLAKAYKAPMFEYFFDSARSILDLITSGTATRFPHIRWLDSHCGGVLPSLVDRIFLVLHLGMRFTDERDALPVTEGEVKKVLREQFWFDLAGNPVPNLVEAMLKFTGVERLVYGSDVPWTPFGVAHSMVHQIERDLPGVVGEGGAEMIYWGNAEKLFGGGG